MNRVLKPKTFATAITLVAASAMLGAAGVVSFNLGKTQAQVAAPTEPTAVAVLNLQDVLGELAENTDFQANVNAKNEQLQAELARRQSAVQTMQNDLELLDPASDAYSTKEDQIFDALIELRTWQSIQEQRNVLDQRTHLANLYRKIVQAGGAVAEQQGYDMVLLDTQVPDLDRLNPEQLLNAIATRKVLFHTDDVDITRDVLERMNTAYNNR